MAKTSTAIFWASLFWNLILNGHYGVLNQRTTSPSSQYSESARIAYAHARFERRSTRAVLFADAASGTFRPTKEKS